MKTIVFRIATADILLSVFGDSNNNFKEAGKTADSSATTTPLTNTTANPNASADGAVTAYLQFKKCTHC